MTPPRPEPLTPDQARAELERLARVLRVAYPNLGEAVDVTLARLDRLLRVEDAAASVADVYRATDGAEADDAVEILVRALEGRPPQ